MAYRPATAIGSGTGGSGKPKTSSYGVQGSAPGAAPAKTYVAPVGSKAEQQARYEETVQTIQSAQGGSSKEASVLARQLEAQNQYAKGMDNRIAIDTARQERNQTVMALSGDPRTEVLQTSKTSKSYVIQPKGLPEKLDTMAFQSTPSFGAGTGTVKTDFIRQDIQIRAQELKQKPFIKSADKFIFTNNNQFSEYDVRPQGSSRLTTNIVTGKTEELKAGVPYSSFSATQKLDIKAEELQRQNVYLGKGISSKTASGVVSFLSGVASTTPKEAGVALAYGAGTAGVASLAVASGVVSAPVVAGVGTVVTAVGAGAIGVQYLTGNPKGAGKSATEFALFGAGAKGAGKFIQMGQKLPQMFGSQLKTQVTGFQDTGFAVTKGTIEGRTLTGTSLTTSAGKVTQSELKIGSDKALSIRSERVKVPSADAQKGIPEYITVSKVTAIKGGKPVGEQVVLGDRPVDLYTRQRLTTTRPAENQVSLLSESKLTVLEARPSPNVVSETKVSFTGAKGKVTTTNPDSLLVKGTVTNIQGTARIKVESLESKPLESKFDIYSASREQQLAKGKSILPTVRQEFKETTVGYDTTKINPLLGIRTADQMPLKSTTRYYDATVTQRTTTSVNTLEAQAIATPLLVQAGLGTGVSIGSAVGLRAGRLRLTEHKIKMGESKLRPAPENLVGRAYPQLEVVTRGFKMFEPRPTKFIAGFSPSVLSDSKKGVTQVPQEAQLRITGVVREPKQEQIPKITQEPEITIKQTPDIIYIITPRIDTPNVPSPTFGGSFFSPPSPPPTPDVPLPPVLFPPLVTTPGGGIGSSKKFLFSSGKQKTKYTPTAFAVAFDIRGRESKGLSSTGLSLRPIKSPSKK